MPGKFEQHNNLLAEEPTFNPEQLNIIDKAIADILKKGHVNILKEVDNILHKEIALKLIEAGRDFYVAVNLYKFQDLNQEVALKLIEAGKGYSVAENLDKFQGLDHKEIVLKIIEEGQGVFSLVKCLDKFQGLDHKEIALKIIEAGKGNYVVDNLDKFQGLDQEVALKLIEAGKGVEVIENLNKFQGLDHKEIALRLIEAGQGGGVANYLDQFQGLDHKEIALKIIEEGQGEAVVRNLEEFQELDHKEIALKIIEAGKGNVVAADLDKFQDLDHKEIALKIIEARLGHYVAHYLDKFQGLDQEVALKLIEIGRESDVAQHLEEFQGLDHKKIALKIIEAKKGDTVVENLEEFQGLDHKEIALKIIEADQGQYVDNNQDKFGKLELFIKAKQHHLLPSEYYFLKDKLASDNFDIEDRGEELLDKLNNRVEYWADQENVMQPFKEAVAIFGYQRMFDYIYRQGLSRHDALHNFTKIIETYKVSGLDADQFYNNILMQVNQDGGEYEQGTAHHALNSLADNIDLDFDRVIAEAKQYSNIKRLQELLADLDDKEKVFQSWKMLKKYQELHQLLAKKEILEKLQSLKTAGKEELYTYIETLAFHPNISMQKVMEFWQDPASFLEIMDDHTPNEVHNRKKPSNYIEFPNLDLTAEELRDALVEGHYDKLQVFRPLEINYKIEASEESDDLQSLILRAIGERKKDKVGEAKTPKKLFSELNKLFKARGLKLLDYLKSDNHEQDFSQVADLRDEILELLYDQEMGLRSDKLEEYRAKINLKSDPDAVVAGNDTACCMPFGSGKNNVYTFNPIVSLFTVQKKKPDGTWKTVAQSVLTKDMDLGQNIADIVEKLSRSDVHMDEVVGEQVVLQDQSVITCDNIEVARNVVDTKSIEEIYKDFFREYLSRFSDSDNLDKDQVIIGKGYTDLLTNLPEVDNTFVPTAPVAYSDNLGAKAYRLDLNGDSHSSVIRGRESIVRELPDPERELEDILPKGVDYLTFEDSLAVAYIEGKAYRDNESLMEYMHNMENALIAKDVNNVAKDRPNMSLKYVDTKGKMRAYLLAYEGRSKDEQVVYVSDLASDGTARAGGSLLLGFAKLYKQNYIDQGKFMPILAQLREKTSYAIITKQLAKLTKDTGLKFELEELDKYQQGDDVMYEVIIRPINE